MKLNRTIFTSVLLLALTVTSFAQRRERSDYYDKIHTKKVAFFTDKMDLTSKEAEKFWPIYNDYDKALWEAIEKRRDIERKVLFTNGDLSDKEARKLLQELIDTHKAEMELTISYNKKFLEVLSPSKVLKLYKAENQFRMEMLNQFRGRR